ncbi:hypothetical protein EDB81DRAFT_251952 [Dactylonectria macrodidyma]|uniref:Uncharacterized protein n=1 Tax=Dactylonectria macrodidyma TaxID=307937 RepID=A0A9P9FMQ7_9HYPO|nr:hypothetical protein EDB81DRAFT_251952 [Dactylonectria macrodidyma]
MTEHWMGYYLHFDDGHYRNPKRRREKRKKKMHDNFWRTLTERRVGKLHFPFIGLDFGNGQEYGTLGANLPSHTHPWLSPRYRDDERETPAGRGGMRPRRLLVGSKRRACFFDHFSFFFPFMLYWRCMETGQRALLRIKGAPIGGWEITVGSLLFATFPPIYVLMYFSGRAFLFPSNASRRQTTGWTGVLGLDHFLRVACFNM